MRRYPVNKTFHTIFDDLLEVPKDTSIVNKDWRDADIGDWVQAEDGCIIQILRKGVMKKAKGKNRNINYIGTCTGTYPCTESARMDTERRANIYSFSGDYAETVIEKRRKLTSKEELFVQYLVGGMPMQEAYLKAFPTNDERYALSAAKTLTRTERVKTAMKEELKPIMENLGIDSEYILGAIKDLAEVSDRDETRLKALFKLSDILDLEDKGSSKVTQLTGAVFQGFSDNQLESANRPLELQDESK